MTKLSGNHTRRSTVATRRAAIYARISDDRESREKGVERQQEDCRALAERLGFEVVTVYVDNDISASTKSKKPRPQYDAMLTAARAGELDAILAYSNSRLTRRPREFEDLIELAERGGVRIATVVSGDDDLSTADGRMTARIKSNVDVAEAERTGERVARAKQQAAEEGRYRGGRRPYGYENGGVVVRESEARVIRDVTRALLEGRSMRALVRELNDKNVKTSTGERWTPTGLRDVLLRPRNAGLISTGQRSHGNFEIVGKAVWDPILPEETWRSLEDLLMQRSRRTNPGRDGVQWLGSGIYRCGVPTGELDADGEVICCGAPLRVTRNGREGAKRHYYRCSERAHLLINQEATDRYVLDAVADVVRDPRIVALMQPEAIDLAPMREERRVLEARLERFERDYALGNVSGAQLSKATALVTKELADVDARIAKAVQQSASSPILSAADPGEAFLAAPLDIQRAVIASVVRVEVQPAQRIGAAWSGDRVRLTPVHPEPVDNSSAA